ncbi:MAG TPA: branched-chain amino acid ABC transporter permease [Thermoleophilaceae bacterium]|nr:branched-chain amino acid ABC transporter permease [Thermoleophilaceae bacterium]
MPIGVDEWVARSNERADQLPGWRGRLARDLNRVGWWPKLAVCGVLAALFPLLGPNDFQLQVGINSLLLAMLALGLNISVGWAGLLDLGYIAFYGFGAYGFALLSSQQLHQPNGIHMQAWQSIPLVLIAAAILGLLVGLPSRRLIGDYLAIVTLFFGEVFLEFTTNVATDKLGGPNGIPAIDPIKGFGHQILSLKGYYYFLLVAILVVIAALHLLDASRTGRAWRAIREDPLAANLMTIPVNRLKLMAFSFGAVVAALAGTIFAAQQGAVFPTDFDTPFLIFIYAGLILGGSGSIAGAVMGGLVVSVTLEFLRNPTEAGYLFYGLIIFTLIMRMRPWVKLAAIVVGTVAFGFIARAVVGAVSSAATAGSPHSGGWVGDVLDHWVIVPANPKNFGNICFVVLVCSLIALVQMKNKRLRTILLIPVIYLAAVVWESRLAVEPSITRQILIGAILIVMMNARPQGLLGKRRVEVV